VLTGRVEITSQNHGFCIDAESLEGIDCEVTHVHLNDGTLAGFRHRTLPVFAVQYHPEASPGPHDSAYLFDCFVEMMRTRQPVDGAGGGDAPRPGDRIGGILREKPAPPAAARNRTVPGCERFLTEVGCFFVLVVG